MNDKRLRWVPVLIPVLIELACSSAPETVPLQVASIDSPSMDSGSRGRLPPPRDSAEFPRPAALEHQVAFWRNVYALWTRAQAVVHDDRYLDVVYEVIDLPGETTQSYTPEQKALIQERGELWRGRLRVLEDKLAAGVSLTPDEQRLVARIQTYADRGAVRGAAQRVRIQRGLRERFKRGLEISGRYDQVFRKIFRRAGLPEDLAYLPHVESSFQASARSSAGAVGIWQFTRSAAKIFMDLDSVGDQRMDPIASAHGAARYLRSAHGKLGSWPLALTSYNHGIAGMQRAKEQLGDDLARIVAEYDHPKFGFASRNFYAEFLAAREVAAQPKQFFPEGLRYEEPLLTDRLVQDDPSSLSVSSAAE